MDDELQAELTMLRQRVGELEQEVERLTPYERLVENRTQQGQTSNVYEDALREACQKLEQCMTERTAEMERLQEELERRVHERTLMLQQATANLMRELTRREKAEDALRKSERRFRTLIEQITDMVIVESEGEIAFINPAAERIFGPVATAGAAPAEKKQLLDAVRAISRQPCEATEVVIHCQDGSQIVADVRTAEITWDGQPATLSVLHDITSRKHMEQELRNAHDELEQRVYERTAKLALSNRALQDEIAERKQAEAALAESEQRFRAMFNSAFQFIGLMHPDGTLIEANQTALDFGGLQLDEVIGKPFWEAPWWTISQGIQQQLREAIERAARGDIITYEVDVRGVGDAIATIDFSIKPIADEAGRVFLLLPEGRDISERKQAEEEARRQTSHAHALVRTAARLNEQHDLDMLLQVVCEEAVRALNVPAASVLLYDEQCDCLVRVADYGLPEEYRAIPVQISRQEYEHHIERNGPVSSIPDVAETRTPYAAIHRKFAIRTAVIATMRREGGLIGSLSIITIGSSRHFPPDELSLLQGLADQVALAIINTRQFQALEEAKEMLTRRVAERTAELSRANSELSRAARAKDEFLATMSHELRTPLNSILGLSESLIDGVYGDLNERQQNALKTVERSGQHLLDLINDILDLSKIEAGRMVLHTEQVAIIPLCHTSLQFIRQQAQKKRIAVSFNIGKTLEMIDKTVAFSEPEQGGVTRGPGAGAEGESEAVVSGPTMQADPRRLKQILLNLLVNAVKFTPEGGAVGLDVEADPDDYEIIQFSVWDTGVGISPEQLASLFRPFVQVDSSLSRQYEGTGLGLALVMHLTELHGGSVAVESEVGVGSRFTISLPRQLRGRGAVSEPAPNDYAGVV